jgi:hypothetical protein
MLPHSGHFAVGVGRHGRRRRSPMGGARPRTWRTSGMIASFARRLTCRVLAWSAAAVVDHEPADRSHLAEAAHALDAWREPVACCSMYVIDDLLHDGAIVGYIGDEYAVEHRDGGAPVVPSGTVLACDPLTLLSEDDPPSVAVPPGRYPTVSIVLRDPPSRPSTYDLAYTAGLLVVLSNQLAVSWSPSAEAYIYAVDRGVACFIDKHAARMLCAWCERTDAAIVDQPMSPTLVLEIDPGTGANAVISDSGGDGAYGVWVGRTSAGDIAGIVTVFTELDGWDEETADGQPTR